jgi:hypothetical protein
MKTKEKSSFGLTKSMLFPTKRKNVGKIAIP